MDRVGDYLLIPEEYAERLGGLRWSPAGDAVENRNGETFVLRQELTLFLEGFATTRPLVHFGFTLHLLYLLGVGAHHAPQESERLAQLFREEKRPLRNAGALCGVLCRDLLGVAGPIDPPAVCRRLASGPLMYALFVSWSSDIAAHRHELPHLGPRQFEEAVLANLQKYELQELRSWLRHGRGAVKEAGEKVAREAAALEPRSFSEVLSLLAENPRLRGAVPFVAQLVSALTLPPRHFAPPELPTGGYADVTNRGDPERLLPSQFGLDQLEFVRRYAQNELLYFRREEPHARTEEELVVLLDQGVRTWGDVRLVLNAAVLALGKLAGRRQLAFRVAVTSSSDPAVDPMAIPTQTFAELLAASDLSANPALSLERILEEPVTIDRDIVLLTHPRNLREEQVLAASRRAVGKSRFFGLAVDDSGETQLVQFKHGAPIRLRQFRVDFTRAALPPVSTPVEAASAVASRWQGPVEPVPAPFRFGIVSEIEQLAFDHAAEWLLTVTRQGMAYVWQIDGLHVEVLPRCLAGADLIVGSVAAALGVQGGFVIVRLLTSLPLSEPSANALPLQVIHYSMKTRTCTVHPLPAIRALPRPDWHYYPEYHALVVCDGEAAHGVDLATGEVCDGHRPPHDIASRVRQACNAARKGDTPGRVQDYFGEQTLLANLHPWITLSPDSGTLRFEPGRLDWNPITPLADGKPALRDCQLLRAECWSSLLAIAYHRRADAKAGRSIRLFQGPEGTTLGEYSLPPRSMNYSGPEFACSHDGARLARLTGPSRAIVQDVGGARASFLTTTGRCHPDAKVELGDTWLEIQVGKTNHFIRWDRPSAEIIKLQTDRGTSHRILAGQGTKLSVGVPATQGKHLPNVAYDSHRFCAAVAWHVSVLVDRFGQIAVFDKDGRLVCMFFAYRHQLAFWLPDGTVHGPIAMVGKPSASDALDRLGRALREATERGRRQVS